MRTRLIKFVSVFTITFLLTAFSFGQNLTITAMSVASCPDTVVVPIRGQDINAAASMSLGLLYDEQLLTYIDWQNKSPEFGGGMFFVNNIGGEVRVSWFGFSTLSVVDEILIEFRFAYTNCNGEMAWNPAPGVCEFTDVNNQILPAVFVDGEVTSSAITSQPPDYSASFNQTATFSVTAPGSATFQWAESTDSLTWTDLTPSAMYSGVNTNTLSISGVPLSMNGYQYRVYVSGGACGDTSCSAYLFVNPTKPIITTIGTDSACYSSIPIPVDVVEFYSVATFNLKLDYDTNIVIFTSYQNENPGLSTGVLNINAVGGQVMIDWTGSAVEVNLGSATLFDLVFAPKPGSSGLSALTWDTIPAGNCEYIDLASSTIPSHYINGSVKMNTKPSPVISGSTSVCEYQTGFVYNAPFVIGHSYNWTVTGGTILFGYANSITVKWLSSGTGTVTVLETDTISGCDSTTADYLVTINPNPIAYSVTGGGGYCFGGIGSEVGLDGSDLDVAYQLRHFTTNVGSPVSGTGLPLIFGNFTETGSYTVRATSLNACELAMSGSVQVTIDSLPYLATVTGGGTICIGGIGLEVGIDTSELGVDYQVFLDGFSFGTPYPGIGVPLSFGIQSDAGTYTVEATNLTTNCVATMTGSATIAYTSLPTADAGSDNTVCEGRSISMSGSATNYAFVGWTTAGDGVFDTPTSLYATYSPGSNDIANGSVMLTLTAYGIGTCGNVSDQMQLIINQAPSINAGMDDTICPNQAYQINGAAQNYDKINWSGGDGVFSDTTILSPTYTPGPGDIANDSVILTLTVYGLFPCDTLRDNLILRFLPSAIADAGSDATICEGDNYTLNGTATEYTSVSWSGGDGLFDDPAILNPTYTPGPNDIAAGSVFLTLVAYGGCGYDSDYITLTINNLPTADAGADATICGGTTNTLNGNATDYSSILWTSNGDGMFLNSTSLDATYIPGVGDRAAGSVTLTLNVTGIAPCGNTTDDMILYLTAAATADAGADATICEDENYVLSGVAANYSSVLWTTTGDGVFDDASVLGATYTPGAGDIVNGTAVLTLTANAISPCTNAATDDMTLSIQLLPTADAGVDATICEDGTHQLNGVAANYSSSLWTTTGDGVFDDATLLGATYTPGAVDIANGSVVLTLAASATSPCSIDAIDDMTLYIYLSPTADAGLDASICEGDEYTLSGLATNYSSVSWTTTGDGVFDDNTLLGATYTPGLNDIAVGSVTLTLTASGNTPCGDVMDDMILTIIDVPTADAGADATICEGETYKLSGVATHYISVLWTGGDGTFDFSNYVGATYTPGQNDIAAGSVTLTLTVNGNTPCGSVIDDMVLTIAGAAVADAGLDASVCEGQSYILMGSAANYSALLWTGGDGTFDDNTLLGATYTPGPNDITAGTVTLTLTATGNSPCGDAVDDMILTMIPAPSADAGADATICEGESYKLAGAATNFSGILWSTTGDGIFDVAAYLGANYTPGPNDITAGTVTLTLTATGNTPCEPATDEMIIIIVAAATADAGMDATICENANYSLSGTASNYSALLWTGGDGNFDDATLLGATYTPGANDIAAGTVTLTLTATGNTPCVDAVDDMVLTIVAAATADAGFDATICEGESYTLSGAASNYSAISWTGGDGTFDDATLLGATYTPGSNDIAAGTVTLTLTATGNTPCGDAVDDMVLTIVTAANADAGLDATICEDANYSLSGTASNYSALLWTGGDGNFDDATLLGATYTPGANDIAAGTVTLTLTATGNTPCGDAVDDMVLTLVAAATADAGFDATICEGESYALSGSASNYSAISWTGGDGTFNDNTLLGSTYTPGTNDIVTGTVTLTLTATGNTPCGDATDDMVLTIDPLPVADAGPDQTINFGTSTSLDATVTGGSGSYTYSWTPAALLIDATVEDPATINLDATTQFDLVVTDAVTGCVSLPDAVLVTVEGGALTANLQAVPDVICEGNMATLQSNASGGSGSYTYSWTSNPAGFTSTLQDPTDSPVVSTWYILTVDDSYKTYTDSVMITVVAAATADAGGDATICEGENYILSGTADNYSSVSWTGGDGTFDDNSLLDATYTPGPNDIAAGTVTMILTAFGNAPCGDASDEMVLSIVTAATADAGGDATICDDENHTLNGTAGNYSSVSWTGGDGTFDDNTLLGATYTPGPNDITAGTVTLTLTAFGNAPCGDATDDMILTIISCGTPVIVRTLLQAPYTSGGVMNTDLNTLIPNDQPYNKAPWNYAGIENLSTIPANMVDWILVELRDASNPTSVIARRAAILLNDGNIADIDMAPSVNFEGVPANNYYLVVHHRNHMPVMSLNPIAIPNVSVHDFSDVVTFPPYGGVAQALIELETGIYGMIAGDVNSDGILKYSGPNNDKGFVLQRIVTETGSTSITNTIQGYYDEDINMNSWVKYSGPGNDPSMIIQNLFNLSGSTAITTIHVCPVP